MGCGEGVYLRGPGEGLQNLAILTGLKLGRFPHRLATTCCGIPVGVGENSTLRVTSGAGRILIFYRLRATSNVYPDLTSCRRSMVLSRLNKNAGFGNPPANPLGRCHSLVRLAFWSPSRNRKHGYLRLARPRDGRGMIAV